MPKRKNDPQLRPFGVTFESHRLAGKKYADPTVIVDVNVQADSVEQALHIAGRMVIRQFIDRTPSWVSGVCWSRDSTFEECGYISGRAKRSGGKLSAPYHLTRRLKATVTLGRIPKQLELDFKQ